MNIEQWIATGCLFILAYLLLGAMWAVTNVKHTTGRDTWPNLWQHRKFAFMQCVGWIYFALRAFSS